MDNYVILADVTCDLSQEIRDYFGIETYIPGQPLNEAGKAVIKMMEGVAEGVWGLFCLFPAAGFAVALAILLLFYKLTGEKKYYEVGSKGLHTNRHRSKTVSITQIPGKVLRRKTHRPPLSSNPQKAVHPARLFPVAVKVQFLPVHAGLQLI